MTWPVALEGHYVSPSDPTEVHTCELGAKKSKHNGDNDDLRGMACPGGDPNLASDIMGGGNNGAWLGASEGWIRF